MAETIGGTRGIQTIVIKGYNPAYIVEKHINGTDIKPGHVITNYGEANKHDIDLCDQGEPPLGIALEHKGDDGLAGTVRDTYDVDTAYEDNAAVRVALLGSGMAVVGYLGGQATTTTVYQGSKLIVKSSGELQLPLTQTTTSNIHTNWLSEVGRSIEYNTGGSSVKTIALVI